MNVKDEVRSAQAAAVGSATPALLERVSWASVLAGAAIALAVLAVLNLIGLAIGLYVVDDEASNLNTGAAGWTMGIWWALSSLASLFVGGWIAGKLAGNPSSLISGIHGLAVWALAILLGVWAVSSAATAAFTGAAGVVGRAAQVGTGAVGQASGPIADFTEPAINMAAEGLAQELEAAGLPASGRELRTDVRAVLNQSISEAERAQLRELARNAAATAVQNPQLAREQFSQFLNQAFGANGVIGAEDRAQAISALADRTGASENQIRTAINNWQGQFANQQMVEQRIDELQRDAARATAGAADEAAGAALWTAIGLILALAAAWFGGVAGRPYEAGAPYRR